MKVKIKESFRLGKDDADFLKALPDNLPETKLTKSQIDRVKSIYRQYIKTPNDGYGGNQLFKLEQIWNWAGNVRVKEHEAKRMLLSTLLYRNECGDLSLLGAASLFQSALTMREAHSKLIAEMYERI